MKPDVVITLAGEPKTIYGVGLPSSDKTIHKDIPALSKRYYGAVHKKEGEVLPFYVVTEGYNPASGSFSLFIGGGVKADGLEAKTLPAGDYGKITVQPKLGLLWGPAIGQAKGYFYGQWLPASAYEAVNMEYEYHTERSMGSKPTVDILFALRKK